MAMSREERCAYSKGYNAGSRHWPLHRPPEPPNVIVAELMRAAMKLRDAVDDQLAQLDPEDDWQHTLGDPMDEVTAALERVSIWLRARD